MIENLKKKFAFTNFDIYFIIILFYGFFSNLYLTLRYSGLVADGDVAYFSQDLQAVQINGAILGASTYTTGSGFQILGVFLSDITALSIQQIQILPIGFLYIFIVYPLFVELSNNRKVALFGTFLLLLLPDLLYIICRGTHERFTIFLFLTLVFLAVKIAKSDKNIKMKINYYILFCLCIFSLSAINIFFAALLILSIFLVSLLGLISSKLFDIPDKFYPRLLFSSLIGIFLMVFAARIILSSMPVFSNVLSIWLDQFSEFKIQILAGLIIVSLLIISIFLIYRNSSKILSDNRSLKIKETLKAFSITKTFKITKYSVYLICFVVWFYGIFFLSISSKTLMYSPEIWFSLTILYWIIIPLSLFCCKKLFFDILLKKEGIEGVHIFLLLYYFTMILFFVISIFIDRINNISGIGINFEYRVFQYLLIFSVLLGCMFLSYRFAKIQSKSWRNIMTLVLVILLIVFSFNSIIKATNDPLVTKWQTFYSPEEKNSIIWLTQNINEPSVWNVNKIYIVNAFKFELSPDQYRRIQFVNYENAELFFLTHNEQINLKNYPYSTFNMQNNKLYDNFDVQIIKRI